MHFIDPSSPVGQELHAPGTRWFRQLNRYHWFVLAVATLAWMFDTMDQQLFTLARDPAMRELLAPAPGTSADPDVVVRYGGYATSIFLLGWATGGLIFGVLGDRFGRARMMLLMVLLYSLCTGLSALSVGFWDFAFYRFITGMGVGGEFAVGIALVAEVMPANARPFALGLLQALSAVGNITAAVIRMTLGQLEQSGHVDNAWRWMFVVGTLPALLVVVIGRRLKEPAQWQNMAEKKGEKRKLGSYRELFGNPRWRKNAIVGLLLAFSGVVGLWGIGFYSIDLTRSVFRKTFELEERAIGEQERDRQFVLAVLRSPESIEKLKPSVQPNNLLGLTPGNKDPEVIYAAMLYRLREKKPVSVESIMEVLDKNETPLATTKEPKPQTPESHQRRIEYLSGSAPDARALDLDSEAERIVSRAQKISGRVTFWAGINSVMFNLGAFFGVYGFAYLTHYTNRRRAFAIAFIAAMLSTGLVFWNLEHIWQIFWMVPLMGFCQLSIFGGYAIYFPELFPTYLRSTGTSFCYNVGRFVAALGPTALGLLTNFYGGYDEPMRYAGVTMCGVFLLGLVALPFAPETKGQPLPE